jgi:hypothetical protein
MIVSISISIYSILYCLNCAQYPQKISIHQIVQICIVTIICIYIHVKILLVAIHILYFILIIILNYFMEISLYKYSLSHFYHNLIIIFLYFFIIL